MNFYHRLALCNTPPLPAEVSRRFCSSSGWLNASLGSYLTVIGLEIRCKICWTRVFLTIWRLVYIPIGWVLNVTGLWCLLCGNFCGGNHFGNLQLLHSHCHHKKTADDEKLRRLEALMTSASLVRSRMSGNAHVRFWCDVQSCMSNKIDWKVRSLLGDALFSAPA